MCIRDSSDVIAPSLGAATLHTMAIAFVKASVLGRSQSGRSVAAHLAYRSGEHIGAWDYTPRAADVLESYCVGWGGGVAAFAEAIERSEKRCDAQLVRELTWALPHDATDEQRSQIVREYAESLRERYGVTVHVARHRPRAADTSQSGMDASGKNHHAHLTLTLRAVDDSGKFIGNKLREMNARTWLDGEKDRMVSLVNQVAESPASRALLYYEPVPTVGRAWHMARRGEETPTADRWRTHRAEVVTDHAERAELAEVATEVATTQAELAAAEQAEAEEAERDRLAKIEAEQAAARAKAAAERELAAEQAKAEAQRVALAATEAAALYERTQQAELTAAAAFARDAISRAQTTLDQTGRDQPRLTPDAAGARPGTSRGGVVARLVGRVRGLARRCRASIGRRRAVCLGCREALDTPRIGQGVVDKGLKPAGVPLGDNQRRGYEDPVISGTGGRADRGAQSTDATAGQTVTPAPERFSPAWFAALRAQVKAELEEKAASAPATPPAVLDRLAAIQARAEAEARGSAPATKAEQVRAAIKQDLTDKPRSKGR